MRSRKERIAVVVLVAWLSATGFGFWWFEFQSQRVLIGPGPGGDGVTRTERVARLELAAAMLVGESPAAGRFFATLIHFSEPGCACGGASSAHLRELWNRYAAEGLAIVLAEPRSGAAASEDLPASARMRRLEALWPLVPAVPAAALFDENGKLIYFGPYSSGPTCGSGISFVDEALAQLRQEGVVAPWVNDLILGCSCNSRQYRS